MTEYEKIERTLTDALRLKRRPVAIAFAATPPPGVEQIQGSQPSGCSFWRLAAEGRVFYTVPSDHYNCAVGSYTHNIPLPPEREQELPQVLTFMSEIGYLRMDEVPDVPRLSATPAVTIYAPLGATPVDPDVVVMAGTPRGLMLVHEAALRARRSVRPLLGRPTCMAIPAALPGSVASSLGCIGNRIYTDAADDEFYTVVAGADLRAIVDGVATVDAANAVLADYHRDRRTKLATA